MAEVSDIVYSMSNTQKTWQQICSDTNLSEWEKYKYFVEHDATAASLKQKVQQHIAAKGMAAVMNDSKWLKLQAAISTLPFPPAYIEKLVLDNQPFENIPIDDAPQWLGNWDPFYKEGMPLFFAIEYIKVRPCYAQSQGSLVPPKIQDATQIFEKLLTSLHIPYEEQNGTFIIYGYK